MLCRAVNVLSLSFSLVFPSLPLCFTPSSSHSFCFATRQCIFTNGKSSCPEKQPVAPNRVSFLAAAVTAATVAAAVTTTAGTAAAAAVTTAATVTTKCILFAERRDGGSLLDFVLQSTPSFPVRSNASRNKIIKLDFRCYRDRELKIDRRRRRRCFVFVSV